MNPDDLLIELWYISPNKFSYLRNHGSVIRQKHLRYVDDIARRRVEGNTRENVVQTRIVAPKKYYDFSRLGKRIDVPKYLSLPQIIAIHQELAKDSEASDDKISPVGVKDFNLLQAAIFHPQTSFAGVYKYPTIESCGAALMYAISNNHSFHNGNKRTALVSLLVYLDWYNVSLICDEDELFRMSVSVASHGVSETGTCNCDEEIYAIALWIARNSKSIKTGERPITLRKLKTILKSHGCEYNDREGRWERKVRGKYFVISPTSTLTFKMPLDSIRPSDQIDIAVIKSLRRQLHLDEVHGYDKEIFYSGDPFTPSEFIVKYKRVLDRLSKV